MLDKLLTLLAAVAELLRRWRKLREQTDHEQQSDAIQENPGGWMDTHFNGTGAGHDDDRLHDATEVPRDASHASKAEAARNDGKP